MSLFTRQSRESIKASVTLYRNTAEDVTRHIQVKIMGCSMLVAMLYKNNTLILIFQRERLWHVYLATWLSGHSTGPISSGTALRNSSRKIIQIDKDLHIV